MAIDPLSGPRKPAASLRSVVLPQPDGPRRVMNSPRPIARETLSSAITLLNRLVTASNLTAAPSPPAIEPGSAMFDSSVTLFDVEHLAETEEAVGKGDQHGRNHDINYGKRRHRRIGELADVVVHGDRQG